VQKSGAKCTPSPAGLTSRINRLRPSFSQGCESYVGHLLACDLEPAGLVEILQRAVHVAFGAARIAPVVEGRGVVRLEPDGLGVILQRAVYVAFGRRALPRLLKAST
jgi:hypothetical protein